MASNARQRKIRLPGDMDEKVAHEAESANVSFNEVIVCAVGYYLSQSESDKDLWFEKFTSMDMSLEALDLRIKGMTTMLLYFIQTFFYAHPELKDGYDSGAAYAEASRMSKEWFGRFVSGIGESNMDFMKELRTSLLRDSMSEGEKNERKKN